MPTAGIIISVADYADKFLVLALKRDVYLILVAGTYYTVDIIF